MFYNIPSALEDLVAEYEREQDALDITEYTAIQEEIGPAVETSLNFAD